MSEEETYAPCAEIIERNHYCAIKALETADGSIHPVIDIADKYFASKPEEINYYLYDIANNILSDMSLMSHFQKCLDGCEELGEFNGSYKFYEPLQLMLKHSNKLLLYMIVDVKTLIDKLTKNTSNISHLFHNGKRSFIITEDKYCIPIIEAHMENPCYKNDFGKTTNKLIQIHYDLLERLENQLAAKIAADKDEDKHAWITERLSFDNNEKADYDDNPSWRKNLDSFYKVRDEQIRQKESKKNDEQLELREELHILMEEKAKAICERDFQQQKSEELAKAIAEVERKLGEV